MTAAKNPNPRTTPRGATRAAQARAMVKENAQRVAALNEQRDAATADLADAIIAGQVDFTDAVTSILSGKAPSRTTLRRNRSELAALTGATTEEHPVIKRARKSLEGGAAAGKTVAQVINETHVAFTGTKQTAAQKCAAEKSIAATIEAAEGKPAAKKGAAEKTPSYTTKSIAELAAHNAALRAAADVELKTIDQMLSKLSDADKKGDAAKRDKLMLDALAAGATFAQIATARGVPYSTNRGLIRVLQGGKRI